MGKDKEIALTSKRTATTPDASEGGSEGVASVCGHGGLDDLERLPEGGDLEEIETGAKQQVGELDGLLLELLLRQGRRHTGRSSSGHHSSS